MAPHCLPCLSPSSSSFLWPLLPALSFMLPHPILHCPSSRERLRTHSIESSGKLKISPEQHCDFTAEDLRDLGEIGRGAYGSVNKMVHKPTGQIMAVKVPCWLTLTQTPKWNKKVKCNKVGLWKHNNLLKILNPELPLLIQIFKVTMKPWIHHCRFERWYSRQSAKCR